MFPPEVVKSGLAIDIPLNNLYALFCPINRKKADNIRTSAARLEHRRKRWRGSEVLSPMWDFT